MYIYNIIQRSKISIMKTYPFTSFEYYESTNLSDNIQSLVTERLFPNIVKRFDRDTLAYAPPMAPSTIVMNEWFSYHPETCLPCFSHLCPIFESYFPRKDVINYLVCCVVKRYWEIEIYLSWMLFKSLCQKNCKWM